MTLSRARFVLVVLGLTPVLRRVWGAVLGANSTRPVVNGMSVRVVGIWLGLQLSKPRDQHGDTNRGCFQNCLDVGFEGLRIDAVKAFVSWSGKPGGEAVALS